MHILLFPWLALPADWTTKISPWKWISGELEGGGCNQQQGSQHQKHQKHQNHLGSGSLESWRRRMAGNAISNREGNIIQLYGIIIPVKKRYFPAKKIMIMGGLNLVLTSCVYLRVLASSEGFFPRRFSLTRQQCAMIIMYF